MEVTVIVLLVIIVLQQRAFLISIDEMKDTIDDIRSDLLDIKDMTHEGNYE